VVNLFGYRYAAFCQAVFAQVVGALEPTVTLLYCLTATETGCGGWQLARRQQRLVVGGVNAHRLAYQLNGYGGAHHVVDPAVVAD
jgi:hypothetical protein